MSIDLAAELDVRLARINNRLVNTDATLVDFRDESRSSFAKVAASLDYLLATTQKLNTALELHNSQMAAALAEFKALED